MRQVISKFSVGGISISNIPQHLEYVNFGVIPYIHLKVLYHFIRMGTMRRRAFSSIQIPPIFIVFHWLCLSSKTPFTMATLPPSIPSPIDCTFERMPTSENRNGFCGWRPDVEQGSARIWHTGNAVLVDSVNSVVRSSTGGDRFAFVQGRYGAPTEGLLSSPLVHDPQRQHRLIRFSYWKASVSPSLDICLEEMPGEPLNCVDTIQGPGQQQWVRRSVELPQEERPYRIVLKAKNMLAAEDIIGIDDIQLLNAEDAAENGIEANSAIAAGQHFMDPNAQSPPVASIGASPIGGPKNPFDGLEMPENEQQQEHKTRIFPASAKENVDKKVSLNHPKNKPGKKVLPSIDPPADRIDRPVSLSEALIRPQIRLSPSIDEANRKQQWPAAKSRFYANGVASGGSQFPDFPSLFGDTNIFGPSQTTMAPNAAASASQPKVEENDDHCRAISCTFMDGNCLWELGPGWRNTSHASISIESPASSSRLASAQFKAPVASYVDFDLWMSDDAELTVAEQIGTDGSQQLQPNGMSNFGILNEANDAVTNEIQLFTRSGATNGGWHRFRVPLRPSFSPVRLLFMAHLSSPSNAFISLSNIRLVNSEGTEIGCQSLVLQQKPEIVEKTSTTLAPTNERELLAELGLDWLARQPAPLQLPPAWTGGGGTFPTPPPFPLPKIARQFDSPPTNVQYHPQQPMASGAATATFNPLKPMFEGIAPIVPLQGNPPRLTALMDEPPRATHQNAFPELLSPISVEKSIVQQQQQSANEQLAPSGEEGNNNNKFEREENGAGIEGPQQLYGATPIPAAAIGQMTEEEEALLPFKGEAEEEPMERIEKENSELTLLPRRRGAKLLHAAGPLGRPAAAHADAADDWPNMMDMGGGTRRSVKKPPSPLPLPSSVTSVLASSHHRGWVERAEHVDGDMQAEFRRAKRREEEKEEKRAQ